MTTKWVPVLVRLEDFADVTALVAKREAQRGEAEPADHEVEISDQGHDARLRDQTPWSLDDLRRLAAGSSVTAERWTRAMDVCCEVPGTWLSTSEVAERGKMTVSQWRDAPRKITRHLKAHYPNVPTDERGDHVWPLCAFSMPGSLEVHWAMSTEQATRWHEIRG